MSTYLQLANEGRSLGFSEGIELETFNKRKQEMERENKTIQLQSDKGDT